MDDHDLEVLFEQARAAPPKVPHDLMARIQADAVAMQPAPRSSWRAWIGALGGAPGVGGLITATFVGVWIGVAPPDQLPDVGGYVLGFETSDDTDTTGFGWDSEEG